VILVVRCANGVVIWFPVEKTRNNYVMKNTKDSAEYALSATANATWETALQGVITHSVQILGAFQNLWVLPRHLG